MRHVPILRAGREYRSIDRHVLRDVRNGEPVAEMSLANRGLIARDLLGMDERAAVLRARPAAELAAISEKAARLFAEGTLPLDEASQQSPAQYLSNLSATTGMPLALCRANMAKVASVLSRVSAVVSGWTRGLDISVIDERPPGRREIKTFWATE